jgi:multimeric flavodoxin WrbA
MKKVTAIVGTASRKHTYLAARQFLDNLRSLGDVETEIVSLSDHKIGTCRTCKLCLSHGEEACPLKDDRDVLVGKMMASDGVVFAAPNLSFHVSGLMKVFLDRLGFVFHRPRFFGKASTSIVPQGIYGGRKIVSYFHFIGKGMGFNPVRGVSFTALDPMAETERRKMDRSLAKLARRFSGAMAGPAHPWPGWLYYTAFHSGRTKMQLELDASSFDYCYYRDKGWFESDYFYPARLGPLKKAAGRLIDSFQKEQTKRRRSSRAPS